VILLLDAHALLWSLSEVDSLDQGARSAIEDTLNEVLISAASIWELEIKRANGKLRFEADLIVDSARAGFDVLPISASDATLAARLPMHHRDPFDRMLIAQAQRLSATIVSRDHVFDQYGAERLPA
jgi:PIN domain nuclease of toxin-antitoxin system